MKKLLSLILSSIMVLSLFSGCSGKKDGEGEVFKFTFASENIATHPRNVAMLEFFKPEIEKRSDGRIKVEVMTDGVLGKESELIQMLPVNAIQGYRGAGYENLNPAFELWNIPFAFENYEMLQKFQDSDIAKEILANVSDPNVYIPATGFTPFRQIVSDKKILVPSDLGKLKVRTPNQSGIVDFYTANGASPQSMNAADVYMGLQQGAIDGACCPYSTIFGAKWLEATDYLIKIGYMAGMDPFMVNAKWYNSLPEDLKVIFNEVSEETMLFSNQLIIDDEEVSRKDNEAIAKNVIDITTDPELLEQWKEASFIVVEKAIERGTYTQEQYDSVMNFVNNN